MSSNNAVEPSQLRVATILLKDRSLAIKAVTAWDILGEFVERFPEHEKSDSDSDTNKFKVFYHDATGVEQGFALVSNTTMSIASRASLSGPEWQGRCRFFMDLVLRNVTISPLAVVHFDNQSLPSWKTRAHHSRILYRLFGESAGFGKMFTSKDVYQFLAQGIFFLNRNEQIVCRMSFNSRGVSDADRLEVYPEPYELTAACGVGKVGAFRPKMRIADMVEKILDQSEEVFASKFVPAVVEPISRLVFDVQQDLSGPENTSQ